MDGAVRGIMRLSRYWPALAAAVGALLLPGIVPASEALAATFTVTQSGDAADPTPGDGVGDVDAGSAGKGSPHETGKNTR